MGCNKTRFAGFSVDWAGANRHWIGLSQAATGKVLIVAKPIGLVIIHDDRRKPAPCQSHLDGAAMTLQLEIVRTVTALRSSVSRWRGNGESVGVVPTMGMLHSGHLRLVGESRSRCRRTIVTIFVNAKQFDDAADFATYPRDEESDRAKLAAASVDVLYCPFALLCLRRTVAYQMALGPTDPSRSSACSARSPRECTGPACQESCRTRGLC